MSEKSTVNAFVKDKISAVSGSNDEQNYVPFSSVSISDATRVAQSK